MSEGHWKQQQRGNHQDDDEAGVIWLVLLAVAVYVMVALAMSFVA